MKDNTKFKEEMKGAARYVCTAIGLAIGLAIAILLTTWVGAAVDSSSLPDTVKAGVAASGRMTAYVGGFIVIVTILAFIVFGFLKAVFAITHDLE